jgi:hypothetical protein
MSPLGLCWHNKMLLPANLPQCPISQLATSCNISWGHVIQDCGDGELSPLLLLGCVPPDCQEEIPPGTKKQLDPEGDSSSQRVGMKVSDAQWNPLRPRNQQGEGSTAHQTDKNLGSNSDLSQEAEGETDHFPVRHPSNCLFRVKPCLSGSGSRIEVLCW